jgi:hypothetical protein
MREERLVGSLQGDGNNSDAKAKTLLSKRTPKITLARLYCRKNYCGAVIATE